MIDLLKAINPAKRINTESDACALARAGSLALWLSAARHTFTAGSLAANFGSVRALAAIQAEAMGSASSADAVAYGIVAAPVVVAVIEIAAGVWQWKRPGVVVPIIWLFLIAYGLFNWVQAGASLTGMSAVLAILLVICAVLHASAIRGANALAKFQAASSH